MDKEKYENAMPIAEINLKLYDEEDYIPFSVSARLNKVNLAQRITIIHAIAQAMKLDSATLLLAALSFDDVTTKAVKESVSLDLGAINRMKGEGS